ncbi:lipid A biosynthesis lauroyl acyltransferase [Paraburkholderia bannensis]|uniref:lipid A biosynthesis lauroyl acyltransferase n=1 Tax=Paraburkholderia bannensis TaxID=765414 RepID=UPI002AB7258D|nr:lipid A biosynthesis lauroyl acyltransferase [Paraburkholderia bannensis]
MLKRIGMCFLLGFLKSLARLPYGLVARLGDGLGWALYWVPGRRRHIVRVNLAQCFPDLTERQLDVLVQQHFRCAIRSYVERSFQWFGSIEQLERLVQVDSEIDLHSNDLPASLLLLGFHFVGQEIGAILIGRLLGRECCGLYQTFPDSTLEAVAKAARSRLGLEIANRTNGGQKTLRWLREGKSVALAPDMDFGPRNSTFVPFFGVSACTLTSVGRLARISGAPVVPFTVEVLPDYRGYRLKIFKPLENFPADNDDENARRMNDFLERQVLTMREQYYWMHRRFKTRPPGEPDFYARSRA